MFQSSTSHAAKQSEDVGEALSRAGTLIADLNTLDQDQNTDTEQLTHNWSLRPVALNDCFLRGAFKSLLEQSAGLPVEQQLVAYDACDSLEVKAPLGFFRKRLDARRNTKPKKANDQLLVCTPFDPKSFNFSKIKNPRERVLKLQLQSGRYEILSNKFPLFANHMLLVAEELVPQQMTMMHLMAMTELLLACSMSAYFNSWCASASVNHFHCHLIDELPPVTEFPLVNGPIVKGVRCMQPLGFPGFCYVFDSSQLGVVDEVVRAMQADNQPHNILITPRRSKIYIFPKPLQRPERSFELYPETVGGPELIGSFTVYRQEDYEALTPETAMELCRINTAPLPSRMLRVGGKIGVDDGALHHAVTHNKLKSVPSSRSVDFFPGVVALRA